MSRLVINSLHLSFKANACSYLQLVALAENAQLELGDVRHLLRLCRGDVRRSLMQLQVWARSGGGQACQKPTREHRRLPDIGHNVPFTASANFPPNSLHFLTQAQTLRNEEAVVMSHFLRTTQAARRACWVSTLSLKSTCSTFLRRVDAIPSVCRQEKMHSVNIFFMSFFRVRCGQRRMPSSSSGPWLRAGEVAYLFSTPTWSSLYPSRLRELQPTSWMRGCRAGFRPLIFTSSSQVETSAQRLRPPTANLLGISPG